MTRVFIFVVTICISTITYSQKEKDHSFKKENIFIGGSFGLGLGSGSFAIGVNPEIGYSVAKWLDASIITNFNYYSYAPEYNNNISQKSFNYGGGIFVRIYPVDGFFVAAIPEYNWIKTTLRQVTFDYTSEPLKITQQAPSLILGIGYGNRDIGDEGFYTMLGFDVGNNTNSPYIGAYGSKLPILRAGFSFYLRKKKKSHR